MKIKTIEYSETRSHEYNNFKCGFVVEVEKGEDADDVLKKIEEKVTKKLDEKTKPKPDERQIRREIERKKLEARLEAQKNKDAVSNKS